MEESITCPKGTAHWASLSGEVAPHKQHIRLCQRDSTWQSASLCWPSITSTQNGRREPTRSPPEVQPSPALAHQATKANPFRHIPLPKGKKNQTNKELCAVGTWRLHLLLVMQLMQRQLSQFRLQWHNLVYREKGEENAIVFYRLIFYTCL